MSWKESKTLMILSRCKWMIVNYCVASSGLIHMASYLLPKTKILVEEST
jgi:hypothetical protein